MPNNWYIISTSFYSKFACTFVSALFHHIQISTCDVYVNRKLTSKKPELHPIKVKSPWYHVGIDFVGPLTPISPPGNRYILTLSEKQCHCCLIKQHLVLQQCYLRYILFWYLARQSMNELMEEWV